jgi:hypothetical protein
MKKYEIWRDIPDYSSKQEKIGEGNTYSVVKRFKRLTNQSKTKNFLNTNGFYLKINY